MRCQHLYRRAVATMAAAPMSLEVMKQASHWEGGQIGSVRIRQIAMAKRARRMEMRMRDVVRFIIGGGIRGFRERGRGVRFG